MASSGSSSRPSPCVRTFGDDPDTPVELSASHAAHLAERIGVEHVALGSAFDCALIPAELGDAAEMPRVLDALVVAGLDDVERRRIGWENRQRVLIA